MEQRAMKHRVEQVQVGWQATAKGEPAVEVTLGSGTSAVMTPELAEELMAKLNVHLGHVRRFKEYKEASTRR